MAEYILNGKNLSDFGITPGRTNSNHLAITGGFDLPRRAGVAYYDWKLEDSVEPFVDKEDLKFGEREIKFDGIIEGNVNSNISALNTHINDLPELFPLSCKWGTWNVKINKEIQIIPIDRNNSRITLNFKEPKPDLIAEAPISSQGNDIDTYKWRDFGLWLESISGGQDIGAFKALSVTQNADYTMPSTGGHGKTEITIKANFICNGFSDFKGRVKSLYPVIGGSGLRKIRYRGIEYTCFATDGFRVTDVVFADIVSAKFQCKLIVVEKNGIA